MMAIKVRLAAPVLLIVFAAGFSACTPAPQQDQANTQAAAPPSSPLYISTKHVSTDCGVELTAAPPPGFADRPYAEIVEMPDMLATWQAVGSGRPVAVTVPDRVSPGYVLIEPGYRLPAQLVNNNKDIIASFENDYFSFTQLLPDGSRPPQATCILTSSKMVAATAVASKNTVRMVP